ncbi:nitroreductase family protein [Gilvimarinus polysaccharolyticus]|uniref:nitroreductase family protein n=1 Tax=Gilvimarinus polysaccharolyticus TaxID=863921 RepID=UPI000673BB48|nr:nitroreductase [Gilvimarinus polysaccharolyticus]
MDAIAALTQRASVAKLTDPAPTAQQLETLLKCAARAADHGLLRPWRFLTIEGAGREALGELFCRAALRETPDLSETLQAKLRNMPLRAPQLLVVIACLQEQSKVPEVEQLLCAGAAAQNIINAAYAQGLGVIWRTGDMAYNPHVLAGLGLAANERLIGYLYLGTPVNSLPTAKEPDLVGRCQTWP